MFSGSAVFAQETWTTLPTINTSFDTSTTVQSKAWFHGHNWWAILPSSTPSNGTWVFRLEANNTWTPVLKVSGVKGRSEAKANGDLTHILIVGGSRQIVTIQYVPALNTYQLFAANPTPVDIFIGETGSLEVDSTGRLWVATDHFNWVYTYYADYPFSTFTGPIILTDQTGLGDVNQIVSFPNNNTIGVFWGNGALQRWGFRIHVDGTDPNVWLDDEVPALAGHENQEMADDHVNLAMRADGTLYAVVKSKHPSSSIPPLYVLVRRPAPGLPGGVWDNTLYPVDAITGTSESGSGRRPQIVLNDDTNTLRVFYHDSSGNVYFRESDSTNINFGPRNQVLTSGHEYVSSTKDAWSGRLVVLATKSGTSGVLIDTNPDLFGYWKMDDGGGAIAKDYSGWGNDATLVGGPTWAPGIKALGIGFDGSSSYGTVSSQEGLAVTTALTLSAWIKPNAQTTQDIISRATIGVADGYGLFLNPSGASTNPSKVIFQLNEATSGNTYRVASDTSYPSNGNTWIHVAATYDGTAMRMYVNGVEEASSLGPSAIAAGLIDVGLGAQGNGARKFRGQMDEVRIYRRALTGAEVTALASVPHADLSITKTNGVSSVTVATQTTYTIQAFNAGPDNILAAITDSLPSRLTSATWTCTASNGAACNASGSGSIDEVVTLPVGGSVSFLLQGTITAGSGTSLTNTATVSPNGIDPAPGNNSASDTDTIQQPVAPIITTQPSSITVTAPSAASFTVVASGQAPLTYVWRRNGSVISGATSATYTLNPTAVSDSGASFTVTVSNAGGTVTSSPAVLTVNAAPVAPSITTQPSSVMVVEPTAATFSVVANGTSPLSYQWRRNGVNIPGANSSSYAVNPTSVSDNGSSFSVVVSNSVNSVTSSSATLTVFQAGGGGEALIDAHFDSGDDGFTYADDVFRGTNQPGYASGTYISSGGYTGGALRVSVGGVNSQNIQNMSGGWQMTFGLGTTAPVMLQLRYRLTENPTYETDEYTEMLVSLDGVLHGVAPDDYVARVVGGGTTTTGWQMVLLDLGIVPAGVHTLALGAFNNQKTYPDEAAEVLIDDVLLQAGSTATPPSITTQPANVTVTAPNQATFSVVAGGSGPLTYQWRRGGASISGATANSYTLNPTAQSDSGATFDVVVTNSAGSSTSSAATLTVNAAPVAPSITTQPASVTVTEPNQASFSVVATGTAPLSYQWKRNGSNIPGATGASYTLNPTSAASDNGASFSVVVSNSVNSVTSASATLTVTTSGGGGGSAFIDAHFDSSADGFAYADDIFRATTKPNYASGNLMASGGYTGGAVRVLLGQIDGSNISKMSGGWSRSMVLATPTHVTLSFRYKLTILALKTDRYGQALLSVNGVLRGIAPNDYLAQLNGGTGGITNTTGWQLVEMDLGTLAAGSHTFALGGYLSNKSGSSEGAEILIDDVRLADGDTSAVGPSITTQPASVTVTEPNQATFSVVATGTAPLSYQWRRSGVAIGGATSSSYTLNPTATSDNNAVFDVVVSNSVNSATSAPATLTVNEAAAAPSITTQPASVTVTEPNQATFSVVATGTAPLSYQWKRNGSDIPGATSSSYTLNPTSSGSDNGASFTVVVSNSVNSVTSAAATLTVNAAAAAPSITSQPASVSVTEPSQATFSVVATGTAPLSYQWKRNGSDIPGATSSSYTLNPTSSGSDNGASFTVVVSNSVNSVTSAAATLTVNAAAVAPSISTQPANVTVTAPAQATFSVVATGTAPLSYQWKRNGSDIPGATGASYTLNPTALTDNGATFSVVVTNTVNSVTSSSATLTVNGGGGGTTLLEAHFDGGADSFAYADDVFKATVQPTYASGTQLPAGGFAGGGVQVLLGGINGSNIQKMSGGWQRSFSVATAGPTTLTFRYKLGITGLKSDRFGQMLVSLNGVLYGVTPNTYIAQLNGGLGGVTSTTGWQQVQINLGSLPAGNYTLALGGYLSGKSGSSETSDVIVDDVVVTQ